MRNLYGYRQSHCALSSRSARSAAALVLAASGAALAGVPSNDLCANAHDLSSDIQSPAYNAYSEVVDASMATGDLVDLVAAFGASLTYGHGIWYKYTSTEPGYFTFTDPNPYLFPETPGTAFLVTSSCDGANGVVPLGSHIFDPYISLDSRLNPEYGMAAGETIYILVTNDLDFAATSLPPGPSTTYDLTFDFIPALVPANDTCAGAVSLDSVSFPYNGAFMDNLVATNEATSCGSLFAGVWFTYTPSWTGYLGLNEKGGQEAAWAYAAGCGPTPACTSGETYQKVPIIAGQPIKVLLGNTSPVVFGEPQRLLPSFDLVPDECDIALPVSVPGSRESVMNFATPTAGGVPEICGIGSGLFHPSTDPDIWYSVTIPNGGNYILKNYNRRVSTFGFQDSVLRPTMGVFDDCPSNGGVLIACHQGDDETDQIAVLELHLTAGTYFVRVSDSPSTGFEYITTFEISLAPCAADFNGVNGVTVQDIFDFLTAWLGGNSSADFNGVNGVTVQDIFDFLTAWLAGC